VTSLSLVAFTLVMTVFAIMEPLRKQGLVAAQLAALLAYTVPAMLSLTLPVAALFASTIVYGRFAQDNELTACRASGLSTVRLLKPALVLGGVVTVMSLFLSNYVTPVMIGMSARSVRSNIMGIVKHKFQAENSIEYNREFLIHADEVEQAGDTLTLRGVVAADQRKKSSGRFLTASTAVVTFDNDQGDTYVTISLTRPTVTRSESHDIVELSSMPLPPQSMPDDLKEMKDQASWYRWDELLQTLRLPLLNKEIRRDLTKITRRIADDTLATAIVDTINGGKAYDKLTREGDTIVIRAARAEKEKETVRLLAEGDRPVQIDVRSGGRVRQILKAEKGTVRMSWSTRENASTATVDLQDNVTVSNPETRGGEFQRRTEWEVEQLAVPAEIKAKADQLSLEDVYSRPESLTANPSILESIRKLNVSRIPEVTNRIRSELHGRIAYGVSCFLMVAMGAALGLMFRGGHLISAFALSVVPAAIVIVLMLMGKQLARNPGVPVIYGLVSIWAGIVALMVADFFVYAHLARR
jgi:lipopolysaccharide export LptBFGC system permease protein LptF